MRFLPDAISGCIYLAIFFGPVAFLKRREIAEFWSDAFREMGQ